MKTSFIFILFSVLIFSFSAEAIRWTVTNARGETVERSARIILETQNVFLARLTQRDSNSRFRVDDAINFLVANNLVPRVVVRHFTRQDDSIESRAARYGLRKLIEYRESGQTAGFQPGEDTIVSNYFLWQKQWTTLNVTRSTNNGANTISICTNTVDNVVTLCFFFTDIVTELQVNGSRFGVNPNAISHTLTINNFPFVANDTRLALKSVFDVRSRAVDLTETDLQTPGESAMDLGDDGDAIRPGYGWSNTISVRGTSCNPTASVVRSTILLVEASGDIDVNVPNDDSTEISFALARRWVYHAFETNAECVQPNNIFWDPDFGIVDTTVSSAFNLAPSVFFSFALVSFLISKFF